MNDWKAVLEPSGSLWGWCWLFLFLSFEFCSNFVASRESTDAEGGKYLLICDLLALIMDYLCENQLLDTSWFQYESRIVGWWKSLPKVQSLCESDESDFLSVATLKWLFFLRLAWRFLSNSSSRYRTSTCNSRSTIVCCCLVRRMNHLSWWCCDDVECFLLYDATNDHYCTRAARIIVTCKGNRLPSYRKFLILAITIISTFSCTCVDGSVISLRWPTCDFAASTSLQRMVKLHWSHSLYLVPGTQYHKMKIHKNIG